MSPINTDSRFLTKNIAFRQGVNDALKAPVLILIAGMIGFGAAGKNYDIDIFFTTLTTFFIFALPGQLVLLEMVASGASLISIALAVTLTSTRFITMTVTLFPQFDKADQNKKLYVWVHLLAMTVWSVSMREFKSMAPGHRISYFVGFGLPCWLLSIPATAIGYTLAGYVPGPLSVGMIFINPLFFLLTFTDVKLTSNRVAIILGCILGPFLYVMDPDSSLLVSGILGGSIAYGVNRWLVRKNHRNTNDRVKL